MSHRAVVVRSWRPMDRWFAGLGVACLAAALLLLPTGSVADPGRHGSWDDTCWGRPVTIRGTRGSDSINGGDGPDVIFAYTGNDIIIGGRGNDRICGRWGPDTINAGRGFDRVNGGRGSDLCLFAEKTRKC